MSAEALRRAAVLLLAAAAVTGCGGGEREGAAPAVPDLSGLNLLVVTVDTLRADRVGAYGDERAATPNLDALAREGVRFERAYAPVPLTLPSHGVLFTGRQPFELGVRINGIHYLGEGETTLAEAFRGAGYHAGAVVSAWVLAAKFGLAQGFDAYDDALAMDDLFRFTSEIPADQAARRFARWLAGAREPFLAWLHLYDPHLPYAPPAPWAERFASDLYRGEVAFADAALGTALAALERRGLRGRTAVLATSDHGEGFGEHGEEGHGLLCYEETLRVPLILAAPGRLAPAVVDEPVGLIDVAPTLLELYGIASPAGLTGRSFAARLAGERDGEAPPRLYFESLAGFEGRSWAPLAGIVSGRHKYIDAPRPELYDLIRDPAERQNLIADEPATARRMAEELRELVAAAPDPSDPGSGARRELSAEDAQRLESLGYLAPGARRAADGSVHFDPKDGIAIERELRVIGAELDAGRLAAAREELAALERERPGLDVPDLHLLRHRLAAAEGRVEAAITALEQGSARYPQSWSLSFRLAAYLLEVGRIDEAETRARAILADDPRFTQAASLLGLAAERRGDVAEAAARHREALALEPRSVPLRARLAEVLARAGEAAEAIALYEELLAEGQLAGESEPLFRLAVLHAGVGDPGRAEELFRRGLALEPAGGHYLAFALLLERNGKRAEAVAAAEEALERRGDLTGEQAALAEAALRSWRN